MTQADTAYVRAAGAGAWTEVAYAADAGAFINAAVAALPATGGEIIFGPASSTYRFTGAIGSISKPCQIVCAAGANWSFPTAGGGAITAGMRFTSSGAGSKWQGGTFEDQSGYAINSSRTIIDIQNGAHDVHLAEIQFLIANTVAAGVACNVIKVEGTSASSMVSGTRIKDCRFACNATREALASAGWTLMRLVNSIHAKVTGNSIHAATPQTSSTGVIRAVLTAQDMMFWEFSGNTAYGLLGLSDEHLSGGSATGLGTACGLVEFTAPTTEGGHGKFSNNYFEVITGYNLIMLQGGAYGVFENNVFGRAAMVDSVMRLMAGTSNVKGDGTSIQGNRWHNVNCAVTTQRHGGYCVRLSDQKAVLLDSSHFTLMNRQGGFDRIPIRVDNTCENIVIGSTAMGFNMTSTNIFPPFSPIIWEGTPAYQETRMLFPIHFPRTPFVVN